MSAVPVRVVSLPILCFVVGWCTTHAMAQPANDLCSTAIPIDCGDVVFGSNVGATVDVAPACPFSANTSLGVWYTLIGNGDQVTLDTCHPGTTFQTVIRVYSGSCGALVCVAGSGTSTCTPASRARVQWVSVPGVEYRILVQGVFSSAGALEMSVSCLTQAPESCADGIDNDGDGLTDCSDYECICEASCPVPSVMDECCSAITAYIGSNPIHHIGATNSLDPVVASQCAGTMFGSLSWDVWLQWVAPFDGLVEWNTCNALSYDTNVVIYEGDDCSTKQQIACNGNAPPVIGCQQGMSGGTFAANGGETYYFRIGVLTFSCCSLYGLLNLEMDCAAPVGQLVASADCDSGDVSLTWNASTFDTLDIVRDGVQIAAGLPGSATGFVDPAPPNGVHTYEVIGTCVGVGGATASVDVLVAPFTGQQDLVMRGETPSLVDSTAALVASLTALGRTTLVIDGGIGDYPCNDKPFEIIWQMNGTWPAYRCLSPADDFALYWAHVAGVAIYTESAEQWGYCPLQNLFRDFDGVSGALDGDDTFTAMDGADSGLGLDLSDLAGVIYTQDQAGNDYTDRLFASVADPGLTSANVVWSLDDALGLPIYATGVYGTGASPAGNVISQSWEFGGFGGDRNDLAARYVVALGGSVAPLQTFRRGDCTSDGAVDIGDAIWTLSRLFSGGASGPCDDACDANDDGGVDIGDAISVLSALFGVAVPLPPPTPGCGIDPTADTVGCGDQPSCP